ncbi:ABC transporter permease [Luteococcus peritonei]|uniref:ABC transporter permease n=1 Tax=Luteococcus peritonei TaxID=88874 RepID=A0ABW4RU46_9ACTN
MSQATTARPARRRRSGSFVGTYGLLVLAVALFVVFAIALPGTFLTRSNLNAILGANSIPALLALGAMIPIATGKFDVSIGYTLGLAHVLMMVLVVRGVHWVLAALLVLLLMTCVGVVNGLLVELGKIDSFVATLGTGSVLYAITGAITNGARVVPGSTGLPDWFTDLYDSTFFGIPVSAWYVAIAALVLWVVLERTPLGRYFYVLGSNQRAADLIGLPTRRYSVYAFATCSFLVGCAGVLLASQQQIGNPSVGSEYMLPAFVAALLGSTVIKPGRPNSAGTIVAVVTLAIGLAGIGQLGANFWVNPLFNGVTLLIAVGLAGWSARRKLMAGVAANKAVDATPPPGATGLRTPDDQLRDTTGAHASATPVISPDDPAGPTA